MNKRFIIMLILASFSMASATIINVPGDSATIQGGINGSSNGDTVLVQPGMYIENINFNGHNIVLGSLFLTIGDTSYIPTTIIDGDSAGSVVTFESGEDSSAVITGFTIQNGWADYGGGIECVSNSRPTIRNNVITGNSSFSVGGAIDCWISDIIVLDNTIFANSSANGGGLFIEDSNPVISGNIIKENDANNGGGIYSQNSNPVITNSTIIDNDATSSGGGIYFQGASPTATNTIIWGNTASTGPGIYLDYGTPAVTYCDVQGGWTGEGNIDCDPRFCDPESGDYYLDENSCCVGSGQGGADIGAFGIGCRLPLKINIPADYSTIQEGINASVDGDTVRVAPGIYFENINTIGKNIAVGSWFMDSNDTSYISSTIIDGSDSGSVVYIGTGYPLIKGFTIQNGNAQYGGGIYCLGSPTISNNIITANSAAGGGAIYCWVLWGNINIINNTISGNSVGGVLIQGISLPFITTITNCILWGDSAHELVQDPYLIVAYCDVEGGWPGDGNINCDPLYCDPDNGNFYLNDSSCCVGAGQGGVDIGAFSVGCASGCDYVTGDVNGVAGYNGLDITYGVTFLKGGPEPICPFGSCPIPPCDAFFYCGDVNGSCNYNGLDITYGVAYLKGGPDLMPCPDCPPVR